MLYFIFLIWYNSVFDKFNVLLYDLTFWTLLKVATLLQDRASDGATGKLKSHYRCAGLTYNFLVVVSVRFLDEWMDTKCRWFIAFCNSSCNSTRPMFRKQELLKNVGISQLAPAWFCVNCACLCSWLQSRGYVHTRWKSQVQTCCSLILL